MPDSTTWYQHHQRNEWGHSTNIIEKWVENGSARYHTNRFVYASNGTDLLEHWEGHDGSEHRVAAVQLQRVPPPAHLHLRLNEVTTYTYSGNKLSTVQTPAGLLSTPAHPGVSCAGTEAFGYTANVSGPTSYTNQLATVTQYAYHPAGWKQNPSPK